MREPTELYPTQSYRQATVLCVHCTARNHETRRLCITCAHEVRIPRADCLCEACCREPPRPDWLQATVRDFPKLAE